ncbi:PREDICTED: uncharacterized protein LOC106789186 [Polistes canadensis]|uniref:uncharacterized protein LOC106789186 n=1 Tax=Polistes canadensis TaxID=91411 RepID=UPI000718AE6D|nr:PREDICTED: uncharacterized protein LOC106789186 [Polistes canadensis]
MENRYDNAMRLVFRYLSDRDLKKLSSINRSWSKLIKEENLLKGPQLITGQVIKTRNNRITLKDNVFNFTHTKPFLILSFTNKNSKSRVIKRLHTKLRPTYCYTVMLKRDFIEDENTIWTIIIPHSSAIKLNAFSFGERFYLPGFFCIETCHFMEIDFEYFPEMRSYFDRFIDNCMTYPPDSSYTTCMIILCVYYNISHLLHIIKHLNTWYTIGPIWGATIDSAEACNRIWNAPPNCSKTNIIQIFITSHNMSTQYLTLNENCNTEEKIFRMLQDLRNRILLRRHSIGFLCTPTARYKDFYEIESRVFKKVFPKIPLAHIFSNRPFGAKDLKEFYSYLIGIKPHVNNKASTLLILSYN